MRANGGQALDQLAIKKMPFVPQLGAIRAIAVLMVFVGHAQIFPAFPAGFGVTVFFFLSGYLITTLLRVERDQTGQCAIRDFYIRRTLRIMPPLYLSMMAMGAMISLGIITGELSTKDVASQIFFYSNYVSGFGQNGGLPSPLWSLAIEEHFYLLFPALFALLMRKMSSPDFAKLCLILCSMILSIRILNISLFGIIEANYY